MTAPAAPPQSTPAKGRAKLTPATPSTRAPAKERGKSAPAAPPALAPAKERAKLTHAAALAPAKGRAKSKQLGGWKKGKSSSSPAASTDPESTRDIRSPHPRTIINNENDRPQALNRFNQFLRPVAASLAIPFPAETFHQFFSLTNKQRASLRSCPHWKLLDVTSNFPRNSGSEAAEAFFQNVLSEEKIEEMSRLQRFDAWANEVAKDMPVLMRAATWEAAMMLNVATLSAPAGPARAAGSGPLLEAAMVRWFERALGATVEDMWRLRPHLLRQKLRLQQPHQKQPWSAYKPTQEADPKLFNLNFPSASGVVKFYPSLPGVVQEFFDDPIMLEYVERSYDAVVVAQTELRANYTPQVKALFELDWCGIGETHRMAIVAKALSNLFFMDDPVQLAGLAGAEGWLPEDPLHPKFFQNFRTRPDHTHPLHWRGEWAVESTPETLSSAPTALFSLLGWLLGTSEPDLATPTLPTTAHPHGLCFYHSSSCPQCRRNFASKLQKQPVFELGSRAEEARSTPLLPGTDIRLITRPRFVRNHLLEPVFGVRPVGWQKANNAHALFQEVVRLGNALWLTRLCREVIEAVGTARRERIFVEVGKERVRKMWGRRGESVADSVEELMPEYRERCKDTLKKLQEKADEIVLGVVFVDRDTGEAFEGEVSGGIWGKPPVAGIEKRVLEALDNPGEL